MSKHSVLLVDDEESIRFSLSQDLESAGHTVVTGENGKIVRDQLIKHSFSLVITNLVMEKVDGIQVLKWTRQFQPEAMMILLTGYSGLTSAIDAFRLGIFDYIEKPCEQKTFLKKVQLALQQFELKQKLKAKTDELKVSHEKLRKEIEKRRHYEQLLHKANDQLEEQIQKRTRDLKIKNIALNEILSQLEIEKKRLKEAVQSNIEVSVFPIIQKLRENGNQSNPPLLNLLEKSLKDINNEFGVNVSNPLNKLTPREIEICDMVKGHLSNKQIAELLKVSPGTIESHRLKIRKKLGLAQKKINLTSYLKNL